MKRKIDITTFNGYVRHESDGPLYRVEEFTLAHRPDGANYTARATVRWLKNGKLGEARLTVKPDGFWSEVIEATLENRDWDGREPLRIDLSWSSGGRAVVDKFAVDRLIHRGVESDIDASDNFIEMKRLRNTLAKPEDYNSNRSPRFRVGDLVIDPQDGKPARISMVLYNPDCWDGWQYAIPGCMAESFSRLSKSQRRDALSDRYSKFLDGWNHANCGNRDWSNEN